MKKVPSAFFEKTTVPQNKLRNAIETGKQPKNNETDRVTVEPKKRQYHPFPRLQREEEQSNLDEVTSETRGKQHVDTWWRMCFSILKYADRIDK
ncbi:hypothetical protein K0M31_011740 [Melipona bicolor]|uniref:Uncharacterized protein n=1 Tax=Melipona bicolor TaxID=60889 RepID=A0AA40KVA7_9HYME|nr:hypothetical protein K0M31_011740 [Melipona bicolor]